MYATFAPERIQLAAMFTKTLKFCKQILLICSVLWFISRKMKPVSETMPNLLNKINERSTYMTIN